MKLTDAQRIELEEDVVKLCQELILAKAKAMRKLLLNMWLPR
jgi:hypothetical protein